MMGLLSIIFLAAVVGIAKPYAGKLNRKQFAGIAAVAFVGMIIVVPKTPAEVASPASAKEPASADLATNAKASETKSTEGVLARAEASVPSFNVSSYCQAVSDAGGGSYMIENGCQEMEREARTDVASMSIPDRVRRYCTDVANAAGNGGSYSIFKGCVEMEMDAKSQL